MGDLRGMPEGEPVYLRDLDGTGSMHVCSQEDPGAVEYVPAPMSVAEAARVLLEAMPNYAMERAAIESRAADDEGEFPPLLDLLDFSGQNKTHTVVREALNAALRAAMGIDNVTEAVSANDIYYLKAIQRRLAEFRSALDGIDALSVGGEAFADEQDWLDTFIDAKSRVLASRNGK